jgi:hypothetical protein
MDNTNTINDSGNRLPTGNNNIPRPDISNKSVNDLRTVELFILLLLIWICVDLWVIYFRNLSKNTFGLDENNTIHTFVYAFAITAIVLAFIILAGSTVSEILLETGATPLALTPESISSSTSRGNEELNWDSLFDQVHESKLNNF